MRKTKAEYKDTNNQRVARIKEILAVTPYVTLQELGDELGVTRERIRQILNKNGIKKARGNEYTRPVYCDKGHEITAIRIKTQRTSVQRKRCFICKPLSPTKHIDEYGKIKANQESQPCNYCGTTITRRATDFRKNLPLYKGNWYCDRKCFYAYQDKVQWWLTSPVIQANIMNAKGVDRE
tara:strand:- start:1086 stop:1625 length:540 start_codon:yes stop_codon:yes gene_type:complete